METDLIIFIKLNKIFVARYDKLYQNNLIKYVIPVSVKVSFK